MTLYNQTLFDKIIGVTLTPVQITALGSSYAEWQSDFDNKIEYQWTVLTYNGAPSYTPGQAEGFDTWATINYYDRALIYYTHYKMSGYTNTTYLTRANQIAVFYRDTWSMLPGTFAVQPHLLMMQGMALHYAATGDADSLNAIGYCAARMSNAYWMGAIGNGDWTNDNDARTTARTLEALVLGAICSAPGLAIPAAGVEAGRNWATYAQTALNSLLSWQGSDGAWRWLQQQSLTAPPDKGTKPFMLGLLADALILYYDGFIADARILTALTALGDYMRTQDSIYDPTTFKAFRYLQYPNASEPDPNVLDYLPALNGLTINLFAWLYSKTGNTIWKTMAEDMLSTLVLNDWQMGGDGRYADLNNSKQFNEVYCHSYKALALLNAASPSPPPSPSTVSGSGSASGHGGAIGRGTSTTGKKKPPGRAGAVRKFEKTRKSNKAGRVGTVGKIGTIGKVDKIGFV